jgi:hypothetical protein
MHPVYLFGMFSAEVARRIRKSVAYGISGAVLVALLGTATAIAQTVATSTDDATATSSEATTAPSIVTATTTPDATATSTDESEATTTSETAITAPESSATSTAASEATTTLAFSSEPSVTTATSTAPQQNVEMASSSAPLVAVLLKCNSAYVAPLYNTPDGQLDPGYYLNSVPATSTGGIIAQQIGTQAWAICQDKQGNIHDIPISTQAYANLAQPGATIPQLSILEDATDASGDSF